MSAVFDHSIYLPTRKTVHSLTPNYLAKLRFNTQWLATLRTSGEYGCKPLQVSCAQKGLTEKLFGTSGGRLPGCAGIDS
jgi:hypothetical protein